MRTILLLAEDENTMNRWQGIFNIALDNHNIKAYLVNEFDFTEVDLKDVVTVVIVSVKTKLEYFARFFELSKKSKIPIVVSKNFAQQFESLRLLMDTGVSAIIDFDMSILGISNVIDIVEKGGYYLNPIMMKEHNQQ
ncbi:hypothetical protein ACIQYL_20210 [Lysinibacillus xylanilyticus]|uniref:hypothetical protein n=1 Tax=Lysinibacillus xylanilyticus TaxID=582475 RepID=UPI0037FD7445